MEKQQKWNCDYCTYANYSQSQCVMCLAVRPTALNEDIFRVSSPVSQQKNISIFDESSHNDTKLDTERSSAFKNQDSSKIKWSCCVCTYFNWPKSKHCIQCLTVRTDNDTAKENVLDTEIMSDHFLASNNLRSPIASTTNLASSKDIVWDEKGKNKWICHVCTFENWPKSIKCSMCGQMNELPHHNQIVYSENHIDGCAGIVSAEMNLKNIKDIRVPITKELQIDGDKAKSSNNRYQLGSPPDDEQLRNNRIMKRQVDWHWINACIGIVENNYSAVETYLSCGGDPTRTINCSEIAILNKKSNFNIGDTLMHIAIRFRREEMLPMLLAQFSGSGPGIKRVPSYIAPDIASDIRRYFANTLRIRKTIFCCHYVNEHATFFLPNEIEEFPMPIQEQLYDELLDRDAQKQLENPPPVLNWSIEITSQLGSRLLCLWNRSAGDCLLDSAMQATWGVFDRDNTLRRALADSLHQCSNIFYSRWKEYEESQAAILNFSLDETQWEEDWSTLLSLASQPGSSLEALHIFALAHILRRPIIVYGIKYVKSFRGEDIGYARFEGVYLPIIWEQSFCIKSPIALGYTRGHFSALVPLEQFGSNRNETADVTYLPLMDCEQKMLPIHFLTRSEMGREEPILRQWLDVCVTDSGLLVAQQQLRKRPLLVAQMLEEWLNHYRRIA
ncbi:ZRANB1 family protein [Megaselia abdita]